MPWSKHSASFSPGFLVSEIVHLDSDADQWFSARVVCHHQHNTHTLTTEECVCVCVLCMHTHSWYLMLEARDIAEGLWHTGKPPAKNYLVPNVSNAILRNPRLDPHGPLQLSFKIYFIEVQLINNVVLNSMQPSDSGLHIYTYFSMFFSIMVYHRILSVVFPCAIQWDLVVYPLQLLKNKQQRKNKTTTMLSLPIRGY